MKLLILAGGFATRLWPLTENRAKPLLLLDGKTILAHILEKVPHSCDTYLLTNKKFENDFRNELDNLRRSEVHIFCEDAHSDQEKVGAMGAVSLAIKHYKINDNVVIAAGDNLLPELDINSLLVDKTNAIIAIRNVKEKHEAMKFGVVELDKKFFSKSHFFNVTGFEEKPEHPKSTLVSTGFFGVGRNCLPYLHEYARKSPDNLGGVFAEFLKKNIQVFATKIPGEWFDVGSFETYLEAHKKLQSTSLLINPNHRSIQSGNFFSGKVFISPDAIVHNCQIQDSIIYPGVKLENCIISQSVIDEDCEFTNLDLNRKLVRRKTSLTG